MICTAVKMMNILDLIIIYLACGSPFGAYYFFNHRQKSNILMKSVLIVFLWIPYSIKLLHSKVTNWLTFKRFDKSYVSDSVSPRRIEKLKKELESFLPRNYRALTIFKLREIIERYSGLTELLLSNESNENHSHDLFVVAEHTNIQTAQKCLSRKNKQKLTLHQFEARKDFVKVVEELLTQTEKKEEFQKKVIEFVRALDDRIALSKLKSIFESDKQIQKVENVKQLESELWITKEQQPMLNPIANRFQTLTAIPNTREKD